MIPEIQVYYDFTKKPLPEVLSWLEEMGVSAIGRSSLEAPQEWLQRYGCCFPWVVIEGRIQLKAGFKKSQLERLLRRWRGVPKLSVSLINVPPRAASRGLNWQISSSELQEFLLALAAYHCCCLDSLAIPKTLLIDSEKPVSETTVENHDFDNKSLSKLSGFARSLSGWEVETMPCPPRDRLSQNFFLNGFRGGHGPIVLVHPDCEGLTATIIEQALIHLQAVDVVVGSTTSGDCYLLGLRSWHEALFYFDSDDVSPACSRRIKAQAQTLGLSVEELPTLPSIQSRDDLERLTQRVRQQIHGEESRSEKASKYLLDVCDRILKRPLIKSKSADLNTRRQGL